MGLFGKKKKMNIPTSGARPPPPGSMVIAHDAYSASQLDAADGIIDGKYFGAAVFQKAPPAEIPYYVPLNQPYCPMQQSPCMSSPASCSRMASYQRSPVRGAVVPVMLGDQNPDSGCISVCGERPVCIDNRYVGPPRFDPPGPMPKYTPPMHPPWLNAIDPDLKPWFGIGIKWLDDKTGGGKDNVAVVEEVYPDSPAFKAGIQVHDQLEFWEGEKIDSQSFWISKVKQIRIGDVIGIGIHRDHIDSRTIVRITGTKQKIGGKKIVISEAEAVTDN